MRLPGIMLFAAILVMAAQGRAEDSPELSAPRLNQLAPVYIVAQLQKFRSGLRGGDGTSDSARYL